MTKDEVIKVIDAFHANTARSKEETLEELEEIQEYISDLALALEEEIDQENNPDSYEDSDEDN